MLEVKGKLLAFSTAVYPDVGGGKKTISKNALISLQHSSMHIPWCEDTGVPWCIPFLYMQHHMHTLMHTLFIHATPYAYPDAYLSNTSNMQHHMHTWCIPFWYMQHATPYAYPDAYLMHIFCCEFNKGTRTDGLLLPISNIQHTLLQHPAYPDVSSSREPEQMPSYFQHPTSSIPYPNIQHTLMWVQQGNQNRCPLTSKHRQ